MAQLRRLIVLALAAALLGAAPSPAALAADAGPPATVAKKAKKCKKKGGKAGKKKCRKKKGAPGSTSPGLPGKPLQQNPPELPPPPVVSAVEIAPGTVLAGAGATGTVTIGAPAGTGGQPVNLEALEPARVSVSGTVYVAAGETKADFGIATTAGPSVTVPITAHIAASSAGADLKIVAEPSLTGVALARQCFPSPGLTSFGVNQVTLDVNSPAETDVTLASSDPAVLGVPPDVTVPSGSQTGVFGVDTLAASLGTVTVTATLGTSTAQDSASVRDGSSPPLAVESVGVFPDTIQPGTGATGTVTLDCEPGPGGVSVALSDDSPDVDVAASVLVPEGSLSATFPIATTGDADGVVHVTATLGTSSAQGSLVIEQFGT